MLSKFRLSLEQRMETEKVPAKVDARKTGRCGTGVRRSGDHDVKSEGELAEAAHETLEADPDIVALILFGSRARGDARPDSSATPTGPTPEQRCAERRS